MIGRVVSTKLKNTATILVERMAKHTLYKKTYVQSKKYLVDDPVGVKLGDVVNFINCKPVSKNKHWRITKILGKNFAEIAKDQLKQEAENIIAEVMPEEKPENSESQKVSGSEYQKSDSSDKSGSPSRSESSEKKVKKG